MMPTSASRDDWALALARFVNCLRGDWDVPGIRAAIHAARNLGSREDVAHALIELTKRPDLTTPARLAADGPHWHTGRTPDVRIAPARCPVPGHEHELAHACRICAGDRMAALAPDGDAALTISPDQAARNERGAAAVRAAITDREGETDE